MKTKYCSTMMLLAAVFMVQFGYSQIPQSFSYQAVIRNSTGQPIASQSVKIQITLTDAVGTATHYKETHTTTTSPLGLVTLNIGGGTLVSGNFSTVPWSGGAVYIKVEVDPAGGTTYTNLGSTKLTSVPFALYAASGTPGPAGATGPTGPTGATGPAGPAGPLVAGTDGQTLRNNGTTWESSSLLFSDKTNSRIGVNTSAPSATLHVNGTARFGGLVYDNNNLTGSDGNVLTKTASGVLWQAPASNITGSGITGNMAFWSGTSTLASLPNLSFTNSLQVIGAAPTTVDDPIFEVKNSAGQVLFGVYQEGVRINIVDGLIKGARGGFAVGGLTNQGKTGPVEYLRITPDSARIYVKSVPAKGARGGFAVGGLTNQGKTTVSNQLIQLTPSNYLIGFESGTKIINGIYNSFLGYQSGKNTTDGSYNVFSGYQSGLSNTTGSSNVFSGYQSGMSNTSGLYNVYTGYQSGMNSNGTYNVFVGYQSGLNTTGASNVFIGHESGLSNTLGWSNNFIGQGAGYSNTTGTNGIFIGNDAGRSNTVANGNILIGRNSGYSLTGIDANTYWGNVFIGNMTGNSMTTGSTNFIAGINAGQNKTAGDNNVIIGSYAGTNNGAGSNNTFVGAGTGSGTAGSGNVFLGYNAGYSETGSNKLYIANSSSSIPLVYGDFSGGMVGINLNPASLVHPFQVGNNTSNGNGAYLSAGGTWTAGSSRTFKDRFTSLDIADVINKIEGLDIKGWYYKKTNEFHIGPVAEDFFNAFGTGDNSSQDVSKYLSPSDVAGVTMIAVKELIKQNVEQKEKIEKQQADIDNLKAELEQIKALLKK